MKRVKVCGITNIDDALCAVKYGSFALGFIFHTESPRYIPPVKAANIVKELPPMVSRIGVFVDMNLQGILAIVKRVGLSAIQLHGNETPDFCFELRAVSSIPIIKAFRVKDLASLQNVDKYYYAINAALFDTYSSKEYGGTGKTFQWDLLKTLKGFDKPIILSGGLNDKNILEAYNKVKPYALDVNSGIEISPGYKDHEKIESLFKSLKN
ncbi:MAG: phosphoribosylanthranilate isomerase [Vampirovibrionia bacterium]